jgi:magnesium chelatase subunit D
MATKRPVYPFSALVGQTRLKQALILNAINPRVGGVLIRGEKGTAKSTAVRALARLLPPIEVVADDPFNSHPAVPSLMSDESRRRHEAGEQLPIVWRPTPLVELPVSASEDRVVGALDLEHALTEGQRRFEPGLLAQANRGILYVDEVNLLDDHLVDLLLDAAAMGVNTVEREGISVSHPSRFLLVGTMNPEEGELRPQLLDRFGLVVEITGLTGLNDRVAVMERRLAYEADPEGFVARWREQDKAIATQIVAARELLLSVSISTRDMAAIANLVLELSVDGHRADLAILETARTQAALNGRTTIAAQDIRVAAELALPHRMRRQPFVEVKVDEQRIGEILERHDLDGAGTDSGEDQKKKVDAEPELSAETQPAEGASAAPTASSAGNDQQTTTQPPSQDALQQANEVFRVRKIDTQADRQARQAAGKRSRTRTKRKQGRYISSRPASKRVEDLAFDATLRAAAPFQPKRRRENPHLRRAVHLRRGDFQQKVRVRRTRNAVCFVVDASWSMAAEERMRATKAAVLSLLRDAYQRRDVVGLVSFQRDYAQVLLPLTSSVELAQKRLQTMPTGGKTPLSRGLLLGYEVLERARRQDPEVLPLMVLLTDAQANVSMTNLPPQQESYRIADFIAEQAMRAVVIDTEHVAFERGLARQLAQHLKGSYYRLDDLGVDALAATVRAELR